MLISDLWSDVLSSDLAVRFAGWSPSAGWSWWSDGLTPIMPTNSSAWYCGRSIQRRSRRGRPGMMFELSRRADIDRLRGEVRYSGAPRRKFDESILDACAKRRIGA